LNWTLILEEREKGRKSARSSIETQESWRRKGVTAQEGDTSTNKTGGKYRYTAFIFKGRERKDLSEGSAFGKKRERGMTKED